ncbi:phage gp6-like head-tail connector protein [Bacillus cereus]|uniref:hypothetical protein n=1 Tax=Bacillus TaxID=1386 RepID=UPI0001A12F0E|nr:MULTISPECIES: hypothetical protein [Bacillus]EEL73101.1 hypothetical protein bcere0027_56090 [Bacillus cereus AH676]KMP41385.1 phage protein [Bacillus cereus]MDZ4471986.1 phage gp6-like head-tail connector protein [Bacillus cereus]MEB9883258.1 phage gp6-like head-tail connector protein [Bacillus cereus]TEA54643.1 phage gp6-like head-tail connector protein [Bacillus sp. BH2]
MDDLIEKLKEHIEWEEGMKESMLSFYIEQGKKYVQSSTGKQDEYLIIMCAAIFYEYRVSEKELSQALDAITPFIIQEQYDAEETDE